MKILLNKLQIFLLLLIDKKLKQNILGLNKPKQSVMILRGFYKLKINIINHLK